MSLQKKPRKIDLSAVDKLSALSGSCVSAISRYGVPMDFDRSLEVHRGDIDIEADWERLGESAWRILRSRRMSSIFSGSSPSEFERYLELLRRSGPRYLDEIFIGLHHDSSQWMFVPRFLFTRHAYILGGSGSGKTTHALAQILIQLADPYVNSSCELQEAPPILIIDMKPNGDRYLRALAEQLAESRNQRLRFYSDDPDYESLVFDPLHCLRGIRYPLKLLETLLKAFSMIYPEGYGSDFFTNEQRVQLMEILYQDRPTSMKELIAFIRHATRGKSGNSDARGLYSALAALEHAKHVRVDNGPINEDELIDFDRFFDNREVIYIHLNSRSLPLLSRDIGKLVLFSLLETASQREKESGKVQCYVAIDEFHRLAAQNIVEMLEDARSAGVGFLLAHQTADAMKTRDSDLFATIFENTSFKQFLTLENESVIRLLRLISPRIVERRLGGSTGTTYGRSRSHVISRSTTDTGGTSDTVSFGETVSYRDISRSNSAGRSASRSRAEASGSADGDSFTQSSNSTSSWTEEMVNALTEEVIAAVNDTALLSLVHVKGVGQNCLTPTGGVPTLIQGLYPFSAEQAREMESEAWPLRPPPDPEWYYKAARPQLPVGALESIATGRPQPTAPQPDRSIEDEPPARKRVNEGDLRDLESRVKRLANRLADEMIDEPATLQRLARMYSMGVEDVINLARAAGIEVANTEKVVPPITVRRLKRLLPNKSHDAES